jgi:Domain of unknown function (DUF2017)
MSSVRRRGERVRVSLGTEEAELLISLTAQVIELLGDASETAASDGDSLEQLLEASAAPVETPRDPVLARLLPDAYRDDDEAAAEFRRLTDSDLRATKRVGLTRVIADLTASDSVRSRGGVQVDLDDAGATMWLYALTDVRLAFGTRIGVIEDMDDERASLSPDSQRFAEIAIYDWLAWLQDATVVALSGD